MAVRHKSAMTRFVESIREQVKENQEFQQNVKQLQDKSSELAESESMQRAKKAIERAKGEASVGSEKLRKTMEEVKKGADVVGGKVREVAKDIGDTKIAQASKKTVSVADAVDKTTEPIRQSETYKEVSSQVKGYVDETSSRYGGFIPKERRRKSIYEVTGDQQHIFSKRVEENPEAGESVVIHKDSAWKESWKNFKETNSLMQSIFSAKRSYEDSDNVLIQYTRAFTERVSDTFGSIFSESESAMAIAQLKETVDPNFNMEVFMRQAREFIIPEVIDAYLHGDTETLRLWCSEATYNVLTAGIQAQIQQGLISDSKILDLRNVEFVSAKVLDNDIPVLVVSFNTQEIILFRDRKTGELVHGKEDHIERVYYACVFAKHEDDLHNPVTGGWRVVDMAKHDSRPTW
ncbi:hypothetical protein THASP1DRAFT_14741 [Thamnocephalis sphaerospora]|uniref:Mitochondrial import inner membrane translocase subunit TIM44 n=1 Tax=Thamnocephalis sphaerospora TaxID=78915 RepID=A0A4P9XSI1_9FUNG|nr:hypothetical protein THASP1DRAFT_14741 [Thamnocephalis sphaerospora]|eukprot:RKP09087.1 hypothetical protein THASP1DRAFT_14741 [Thamnocephalis sphaerospora]